LLVKFHLLGTLKIDTAKKDFDKMLWALASSLLRVGATTALAMTVGCSTAYADTEVGLVDGMLL
jgi:hypothetical protein